MEPLDALRRIAFLMERSRAGSYRIKAFRTAADTVARTPTDALRTAAADGTLTQLPGIGRSTEAVIRQALQGSTPEYLRRLEADSPEHLAEGGQVLRAALRGDCHSHSDWSDGGSPIPEMAVTAMELGHEYLVLSDHSPSLRVANGLSATRLAQQLAVIDAVNANLDGFQLLKGIEVDILAGGELDQNEEMLRRLDVRVASVHSALRSGPAAMTQRMVSAVTHPAVNILGHCTGRLVEGERGTRPPSTFDAAAVFAACAAHDTAVEINSRPERQDPPDELITLALEAGCLFAIDSDAHAPGQLDFQQYGCERAQRLGVPAERIVNTWDAATLTAWANPD